MVQGSLQIPQEVLEKIIDCLPHDELDSLRAVALASRRLVERARCHLFRNVYLTKTSALPPGTWKISHYNPSLFKYARQMFVKNRGPDFKVPSSVIEDILVHVQGVQVLEIDSASLLKDWIAIGLFGVCTAIVKLSIELRQDVPLDMFYTLPQLQELHMSYGPYMYWGHVAPVGLPSESEIQVPPWQLKSLQYRSGNRENYHSPLLASPKLAPHVYGGLVHLSIEMRDLSDHNFALSRVLPACQHSPSEALRLWYSPHPRDSQPLYHTVPGGLLRFPLLRYLSIGLLSLQANEQTAVSGHQGFLRSLIGGIPQPSLEAIHVLCSWDKGSFGSQFTAESPIIQNLSWGIMDAIFTDRALYPELRALRLTTQVGNWSRPDFTVLYHPTVDSDLEHTLGQQMTPTLSAVMGSGLLLDVGLEEAKQGFDRAVESIFDGGWGDGGALEYLF